MTNKTLFIGAAALLMFSGGGLHAQDQGWYIGVGVGQSKAKDVGDCSDLQTLTPSTVSCSTKDTSTGGKVFGGYQFNQYVAAEAGYVNLGKFTLSASVPPPSPFATASASDKVSGLSVDAVGTWPITPEFALLGRIGIFFWKLEASSSIAFTNPLAPCCTSDNVTGAGADFGVGAKYDFAKNMGVRAEFQRFKSIGNDTTGKTDVDLLSASFVYRFR
jgi:OOP family OmpA-OmpF porin